MPLYQARKLTQHKGRFYSGAQLQIVDPATGEIIGTTQWADTDWGLLKCFRLEADGKRIARVIEFTRDGKARFTQAFDLVRRDFDVVDRRTKITIHKVRVRGEYTYDLLNP